LQGQCFSAGDTLCLPVTTCYIGTTDKGSVSPADKHCCKQ